MIAVLWAGTTWITSRRVLGLDIYNMMSENARCRAAFVNLVVLGTL